MAKILIADDDAELRVVLLSMLGDQHDVTVATDGREALERLERDDYDVAILDWMMPGLDGTDVVRSLRNPENPNRDLPVIVVTAKSDRQAREASYRAGADSFMTKPFDQQELLSLVNLHLLQPA